MRARKGRRLPLLLHGSEPDQLLRATTTGRDWLVVALMRYMGLRVSEVCRLEVAHLDLAKRLLTVREGKGRKDRVIPIPSVLVRALTLWIAHAQGRWLFPSARRRGPISTRAVQLLVKRLARAVSLGDQRRATPHKFRHAFASDFLDRTENLIALRDVLGHASVSTTQIYTHVNPERLRALMEPKRPDPSRGDNGHAR